MKIIIFNGPPDSGKDEAVSYLAKTHKVLPFSFKRTLTAFTCVKNGISKEQWAEWYTREGKEMPRKELNGLSQRDELIDNSEHLLKPVFGKDFFGVQEARILKQFEKAFNKTEYEPVAACSDGGFNEEIEPLAEAFGGENVHIIRIEREGRTFKGDSRSWIDTDSIPDRNYQTIANDGSLRDFHYNIDDAYKFILKYN